MKRPLFTTVNAIGAVVLLIVGGIATVHDEMGWAMLAFFFGVFPVLYSLAALSDLSGRSKETQRSGVTRSPATTQSSTDLARVSTATDEWSPPLPQSEIVEVWGQPSLYVEAVGMSYRQAAVRRAMRSEPGFNNGEGAVIREPVVMVADPQNPFSPSGQAVAVYLRGDHVGYLPEKEAHHWHRYVRTFENHQQSPAFVARTWAVERAGRLYCKIGISPPVPNSLLPANGFPTEPHAVVPRGPKRKVTRVGDHMDALDAYLQPDEETSIAAVLRKITDVRPRSTKDVVQVEVSGRRVGVLTDGMSEKLLPLVEYVEARGKVPVVRAACEGNKLAAEVSIWVPTASEVDQAWLDSLGPEVPKPTEVIPGPDFMWGDD